MKVIYPSLVEEGYRFCLEQGIETTKEEIFKNLVEKNIINAFGFPTEQALAQGFVCEFTEEENDSFEKFLSLYPVFKSFKTEIFEQIEGYWEIKADRLDEVLTYIEEHQFNQSEWMQIEAYFEQRGFEF